MSINVYANVYFPKINTVTFETLIFLFVSLNVITFVAFQLIVLNEFNKLNK